MADDEVPDLSGIGKLVQVGARTLRVGNLLGEGGFAYVNIATDTITGETFALKKVML